MLSTSILVRTTDGKRFSVAVHAHWSTIRAEDGEEDTVKWYGPGYVSASKGYSYTEVKS